MPPSATEGLRASLMGRKICVVLEKSGRASLRVRTSRVCISMKAMEGRRRTMCEAGKLQSFSRSRYLLRCQLDCEAQEMEILAYSSQNAIVCEIQFSLFTQRRGRGQYAHYP